MKQKASVQAWDMPTRLFKWALVLAVAMAWASNKYGGDTPEWHKWNGYLILVLVVFRLFWGLVGGATARFSLFFPTPGRVMAYLGGFVHGERRHYLGHNPLGACMILLLLAALFCQALVGLYSADPDRLIIEGPLAHTVSDATIDKASHLHNLGFNILLALIAVHVTANLAYDLIAREGLVRAMILGRKPAAAYSDLPQNVPAPAAPWRALLCLAAACLTVFGGIHLFGGRAL